MSVVKIKQGYVTDSKGRTLNTLQEALAEQAKCHCGGIDCCLGYISLIDAATGNDIVLYVNNGSLVIEDFDTGLANLKTLYKNR